MTTSYAREIALTELTVAERVALFGADPLPLDMPPEIGAARYSKAKMIAGYIMSPGRAKALADHWRWGNDACVITRKIYNPAAPQ